MYFLHVTRYVYVECTFRTWMIITIIIFHFYVVRSNIWLLTISLLCHLFIKFGIFPFSLLSSVWPFEFWIFQALFSSQCISKFYFRILIKCLLFVYHFLWNFLVGHMFSFWYSQNFSLRSHNCCIQSNSYIFFEKSFHSK